MISFKDFTNRINVKTATVDKARELADSFFRDKGSSLTKEIPKFGVNYKKLATAVKGAKNVRRSEMPVILQNQLKAFRKSLEDDGVKVKTTKIAVGELKPIQNQIWLDSVLPKIIKPPPRNVLIITSKDGHIIDGHHRWATKMLKNPRLTMNTLEVALPIDQLLKVARKWGMDAGNTIRESVND